MKKITDIWFKTEMDLEELGRRLDLLDVNYDQENVWEWLTGDFQDKKINISRTHLLPAEQALTSIALERKTNLKTEYPESFRKLLVSKLREIGITPIYLGEITIGKNNQTIIISLVEEVI